MYSHNTKHNTHKNREQNKNRHYYSRLFCHLYIFITCRGWCISRGSCCRSGGFFFRDHAFQKDIYLLALKDTEWACGRDGFFVLACGAYDAY